MVDVDQAEIVCDTMMPYFSKALDGRDIELVSLWKGAPTGLIATTNMNTVASFKGKQLRAWMPILVEICAMVGAQPTQLAFSEMYTAMQQGVVDGCFYSPSTIMSEHYYEVAKYYDRWDFFTMTNGMVISQEHLENLSPANQKIVVEAWQELERWVWDNEYYPVKAVYQAMQDEGINMVFPSEAEIAKFRALTDVTWDGFLSKTGAEGLEMLNATMEALGRPAYK